MDVGATLIKLKPNTFSSVEDWKKEIQARKDEAIETLKTESITPYPFSSLL